MGDGPGVPECHEKSCSVTIRCCRAIAVYRRRAWTDHSIYHVFLHPPFRPKPHRRPGQRKPPPAEDAFCSYNVLIRVSSVFWRRRRSGSGLGISPAKGQGPRRRPLFRLFRVSQRNPLQQGKCRSESGGDGGDPECCQNRLAAVRGWRRANPTRRAKSAPTSPSDEGEEQRRRTADRPRLTPHRPVPILRPAEAGPLPGAPPPWAPIAQLVEQLTFNQ